MTRTTDLADMGRSPRRRGEAEKSILRMIRNMGDLAVLANDRGDLEILRFCGQMIERMGCMLASAAETEGRRP